MVTHAERKKARWGQGEEGGGLEVQVGHTGALALPPSPSPSFLFLLVPHLEQRSLK